MTAVNGVVPNVRMLAELRDKAREFSKTLVNFLTAHDLSTGMATCIEPLSDGMAMYVGMLVLEFRELGWEIISHSAAAAGVHQATRAPMILTSLLIERRERKATVHLG